MADKIGGLRGTARKQARDIDYAHKLTAFDREWLSQFLRDLPQDHADDRDIMVKFHPDWYSQYRQDGSLEEEPVAASAGFERYRCPRCLKREECTCPQRKYKQSYGVEDWLTVSGNPEEAMLSAEAEAGLELLPYGNCPYLRCGDKVKICLPRHYLNKCTGLVLAYRFWTDQWLIEADRAGRAGEDGTRSATTLCWVSPQGLKLA